MIGQIIYNLEDYGGTGGLISSTKDIKPSNEASNPNNNNYIISSLSKDYEEKKINIYTENVFKNFSQSIYKLGIQAPPGTKFYIDGQIDVDEEGKVVKYSGQEIIVGRTGIYELDDDIKVERLVFARPKMYTIDVYQTNNYVSDGVRQMEKAKTDFDKAYRQLKLEQEAPNSTITNEKFWEQYEVIHNKYLTEYNAARARYIKGLAGVYVENDYLQDLKNVIIDFMFTTFEGGSI